MLALPLALPLFTVAVDRHLSLTLPLSLAPAGATGVKDQLSTRGEGRHDEPDGLTPAQRQAQRRAWARLVRRVYETDPLICSKCGGAMRIISVILDPAVIRTILDHLRKKTGTPTGATYHNSHNSPRILLGGSFRDGNGPLSSEEVWPRWLRYT